MGDTPRRLVDEMPAKLGEIERLARKWFTDKMAVNGFMFDADGTVVLDPRHAHDPVIVPPSLTPQEAARPLQETWGQLQSDLDTLRVRIERFYNLDPLDFTILVGKLGGTVHKVAAEGGATSVHDRIGYAYAQWLSPVDGMIGEKQWMGNAATSFQERFLKPFHAASQQQQAYAQILAMTAQVYHDAATVAHRRLLDIADVSIAQLAGGTAATRQYTDVEGLSWVSMVTGGLALFPPLGMAAGTFLGWTSFVTAVTGYLKSKENVPEDPETIADGSATRIIQSALSKVLTIEETLAGTGDETANALGQELDSPTGFASSALRLERPDLANGPGDMSKMTIDKDDTTNNDVVVAVADVYKAGYVNLPGAAGQYAQARAKLASCVPSGATYTYFGRSAQLFAEARDLLVNILGNVGESLTDCGRALVAVATEYQLTDEESAAYLQRVRDLVQPTAVTPGTPRTGAV
jgi:uncharacterized protein YukE